MAGVNITDIQPIGTPLSSDERIVLARLIARARNHGVWFSELIIFNEDPIQLSGARFDSAVRTLVDKKLLDHRTTAPGVGGVWLALTPTGFGAA